MTATSPRFQTVLLDEGFNVTCLYDPTKPDVMAAIDRMEPDCVLLDGGAPAAYGPSWDIAAWLAKRARPIPAIMLSGHLADREEAMLDESDRAKTAQLSTVIGKPFDIDQLTTVECSRSSIDQTDRSERGRSSCRTP